MRAYRYEENQAEAWLHAARDKVIDGVERLTEKEGLSRWQYFWLVISVKARCLGAVIIAIGAGLLSSVRVLWLALASHLIRRATPLQLEEAWADAQESVDLILTAFSALLDSEAVLSASDRGNIRRIYMLGRKLQDIGNDPKLNPETRKELDAWYRSAKVFVRKGGGEARTEMTILAEAIDQIKNTPEILPEKLLSYRWDKKVTGSVEVEKIRGIRWKNAAVPVGGEDLTKRTWTKKSS